MKTKCFTYNLYVLTNCKHVKSKHLSANYIIFRGQWSIVLRHPPVASKTFSIICNRRHIAYFAITGDSVGGHSDNVCYRQWHQCGHHDNPLFSLQLSMC